jgi:MOSC domain-containing protein YiiM
MAESVTSLLNILPQKGRVTWIGLRPSRRAGIEVVDKVQADTELGLIGDRYCGTSGKRQVTIIQAEHLPAIASNLGLNQVSPETLRRNIVVERINLLALKNKQFSLGDAILEYTGLCHPCSYMEQVLGAGGYNAMRGHGGITARVIKSGSIEVNSELAVVKI